MADKNIAIKEGVFVADEVLAIIAGLAATDVEGVTSLAGNLTSDVIPKAGMNRLSKGIRLNVAEDKTMTVRIALNIAYGFEIPKVCEAVQDKIKTTIESMTGLTVANVDIRIAAVNV